MEKLLHKHGYTVNDLLPFDKVRLLSDIKELKAVPEKAETIIKLAEAELERPLFAIPISSFIGYYNGTAPETIPEFYERRHGALVCAIAESLEGKGRFVNRIIDLVWCILEETVWIHPAHLRDAGMSADPILPPVYENGQMHGVDLRTGMTVGTLSFVYMICKDIFDSITPNINKRIIKELREKALYPYIRSSFWWDGAKDSKVINWGTWITSDMLIAIAIAESDENIRRAVFDKAMMTINSYTLNYFNDGGCDEGPGYWAASCGGLLDCLDLLYDLSGGKIDIYKEPHVKRIFEFAAKYNIHGNLSINFADAGPINVYNPELLMRMGEKTDSDMLRSFAGHMMKYSSGYSVSQATAYRSYRSLFTKSPEPCEFRAPKNVWFPDLKVGYTRQSENTSEGMFVCMCGGNNGTSHNHNDLGSVVVYYGGNPVLIDTGVGGYKKETFGPKRYTLTTHSSGYHNTVNVGEYLQCHGAQYRTEHESYDESSGKVSMQIKGAYPKEAGIISYVRECGIEDAKAVITDKFELDGEREVDIHFVTHREPKLLDGCRVQLTEGRVMRYDERLSAEIEAYPAYDNVIESRWKASELYNIHLRAKIKDATFVTVIE